MIPEVECPLRADDFIHEPGPASENHLQVRRRPVAFFKENSIFIVLANDREYDDLPHGREG